ncbi:MAG TPA: MBL fold metallo-hydrolase [Acidobacteriaceae bacterium]|nr:MBL fold metallo-hydrolase [Acidobacteriaceae bacterium]
MTAATSSISRPPGKLFTEDLDLVPTMIHAAATTSISVHPLRRNIAVLQGSGGNIAVLTGEDGKLLVDAGFSVSQTRILAALDSISQDPIRHLINSHWHTDHTDGNQWLHSAGATITAQKNTRKHLSMMTRVAGWAWDFPARPAGALPTNTFDTGQEMYLNHTSLILEKYDPGHTDSDISVNFIEADILLVADTWWNGVYPFIDYSTGGSIDGQIRAAQRNVDSVTADTIVIPGHGPVGDRAGLIEFRDMLVAIREKVAGLKRQGMTLFEAIAAKPTAAFDAKWGQFLITPSAFTGLVYQGV